MEVSKSIYQNRKNQLADLPSDQRHYWLLSIWGRQALIRRSLGATPGFAEPRIPCRVYAQMAD